MTAAGSSLRRGWVPNPRWSSAPCDPGGVPPVRRISGVKGAQRDADRAASHRSFRSQRRHLRASEVPGVTGGAPATLAMHEGDVSVRAGARRRGAGATLGPRRPAWVCLRYGRSLGAAQQPRRRQVLSFVADRSGSGRGTTRTYTTFPSTSTSVCVTITAAVSAYSSPTQGPAATPPTNCASRP